MKITVYIFICILFYFTSCKTETQTKNEALLPIIEAETYALILAEAQLIEAHGSILRVYQPYYKDSIPNYYAALFDKYNVTSDDFYQSMKAYAAIPDELDDIYNLVTIHLEEIEAGLVDELIVSKPISTISRQQVGDILIETPFMNSILNDSTDQLPLIQDSLFQYIIANDSIVKLANTNVESFQFSFIVNSHQKSMYTNLKSYLKGKLEKENRIK